MPDASLLTPNTSFNEDGSCHTSFEWFDCSVENYAIGTHVAKK